MVILLHGPSGCGKDTQVELLMKKYDFQNIGTGDMFRNMYKEGDEDAVEAHEYWSKGLFVPNELTYKMFDKWVKKYDPEKNWAFVSVVRDPGQIPYFDNLLKENNKELDAFIHFNLSEETAVERMSVRTICEDCGASYHPVYKKELKDGVCDLCGGKLIQREDDKPEKIKSRLEEYKRTIDPILDEYRKRGLLIEVDAAPSIQEIHEEIVKQLDL
jgi:adenylate kinase